MTTLYHLATLLHTTLQIFEWCNYMSLSGRIPSLKDKKLSSPVKEGSLSAEQLCTVNQHYMVVLPGYSKIVEEYEEARKRAQVSRKISLFPSRPTWSPPGREITVLEKMYLQGPENLVKFYNRMEVCQNKTGRWIVYTTAESEKSQ